MAEGGKAEHGKGIKLQPLLLQLQQLTGDREFRLLKLAAWCLELAPKKLEKVNDISDLHTALQNVFGSDANAILFICLMEVQVDDDTVKKLPFEPEREEYWRQEKIMRFALMIIGICNQIADDDCQKFIKLWKDDIPEIAAGKVLNIEAQFKLLFKYGLVGLEKVERLKQVLKDMGSQFESEHLVKEYLGEETTSGPLGELATGSRCNREEDELHQQETTGDEDMDEMTGEKDPDLLYCLPMEMSKLLSEPIQEEALPPGTSGGQVFKSSVWDMSSYSVLYVHFMNPNILKKENWRSGTDPLSRSTILAWAGMWNANAEKYQYPKLADKFATADEAQIRVKFSSSKSVRSHSCVGRNALGIMNSKKPTMILNLFNKTKSDQTSLVIHEFGHVLGLEHEHQRSKFWDVLGQKCGKDYRFLNPEVMPFLEKYEYTENLPSGETTESKKYDPHSIMHYWFKISWLKSKYQNKLTIEDDSDLKEEEKEVLRGVHTRDLINGSLPKRPSSTDYETLKDAYYQFREKK